MLDTRRRRRRLCFYEHPSYTSTSVALPPRCNFHGCGDRGLRHDSSSTTTPTKSEMLCCCWRYESPKTQHTTRHTRHNSTVSTFHYSTLTQIPPNIANSRQCVCMSASECLSACVCHKIFYCLNVICPQSAKTERRIPKQIARVLTAKSTLCSSSPQSPSNRFGCFDYILCARLFVMDSVSRSHT